MQPSFSEPVCTTKDNCMRIFNIVFMMNYLLLAFKFTLLVYKEEYLVYSIIDWNNFQTIKLNVSSMLCVHDIFVYLHTLHYEV